MIRNGVAAAVATPPHSGCGLKDWIAAAEFREDTKKCKAFGHQTEMPAMSACLERQDALRCASLNHPKDIFPAGTPRLGMNCTTERFLGQPVATTSCN